MCHQSATVCLTKPPTRQHCAMESPAGRLQTLADPRCRHGKRHPFVAAGRSIRAAGGGPELAERRLLAEWSAGEDEPVQFWLSNRPSGMPPAMLVRLTKLRRRIEHDHREMKQALGLAHFEGRTWSGWHHHVTLVSAAHVLSTLQRLDHRPKDTAQA